MKTEADDVLKGLECEHPRMFECHPSCGHFHCPDCDLSWDDYGEGSPPDFSELV